MSRRYPLPEPASGPEWEANAATAGSVTPQFAAASKLLEPMPPSRRRRPQPDLEWLDKGSKAAGILPQPKLAAELQDTFRGRMEGITFNSVAHLSAALRAFAEFVSVKNGGASVQSCADVNNATGNRFKLWLLEVRGISTETTNRYLNYVRGTISDARRSMGYTADLLWPTVKGRGRRAHVDVDMQEVGSAANALLAHHECWGNSYEEGRRLLAIGVDPRQIGDGNDTAAWSSAENVAVATHRFVRAAISAPQMYLNRFEPRLAHPEMHGLPGHRPPCTLQYSTQPFDLIRWYAPTFRDVAGSYLLLMLVTGWNPETTLNIVFKGSWARTIGVDAKGRERVEIRGIKLRTGKVQKVVVLKEGYFSAYRIVADVIQRTEMLRTLADDRLNELTQLAAAGDHTHRAEMQELADATGSLWLYLRNGTRPNAISNVKRLLHRDNVNDFLQVFIPKRHEEPVREGDRKRPKGERRDTLLPSDFRDAFADYVLLASDGSIEAVSRELLHESIGTSVSYTRQGRMIRESRTIFADFMGMVIDEVRDHGYLDPAVLYLRARCQQVTPKQRRLLMASRSANVPVSSVECEKLGEIEDTDCPEIAEDDGNKDGGHRARRTLRGLDAAAAWPDYDRHGRSGDAKAIRPHLGPPPQMVVTVSSSPNVWTEPWENLAVCEVYPGCRVIDDVWIVPADLVGDSHKHKHKRELYFAWVVPVGWRRAEPKAEAAVRRLKRLSLLFRDQSVLKGSRIFNPPAPSTWVDYCKYLLHAGRVAQQLAPELEVASGSTQTQFCDDRPLFATLTPNQIRQIKAASPGFDRFCIPRLNSFLSRGVCDDWPAPNVASTQPKDSDTAPPFEDVFVAAALKAALWLVETAGPDILSCLEHIREVRRGNEDRSIKQKLAEWKGDILQPGCTFPFGFSVRCSSRTKTQKIGSVVMKSWPPMNYSALLSLVTRLEEAHLFILGLCTCGRRVEVEGMPYECLSGKPGQILLTGTTLKTSDKVKGDPRDWVLPEAAAIAARQQQRLIGLVAPGSIRLFPSWRGKGTTEGILTKDKYLKRFVERVYLEDGRSVASLCSGEVQYSRLRVTGVRLAALALPGADAVLPHVLDHARQASTVGYVQANPDAALEIPDTAERAVAALRATCSLPDDMKRAQG